MKILWVIQAPIGKAGRILENSVSQSGNWIDAAARALIDDNKEDNIDLAIATTASTNQKVKESGITYYGVNGDYRVMGKLPPKKKANCWRNVITDFKPDIIVMWGTEYSIGWSILNAAGNIPVLFYIQGVIGAISQYKYGLLSKREVSKLCPFEIWKFYFSDKNQKQMEKQAKIEIEMLKRSSGIIVDNDWCESYYKAFIPNIKVYRHALPIGENFVVDSYNINNESHDIFTIAGTGPHKGLHNLLKALSIVIKQYPDTNLYIPGAMSYRKPLFIFQPVYVSYLKKLILELKLEHNVFFCGQLSAKEMAEQIQNCAVYVMPSCIENHSSSLREAMIVGAPCVSSFVGSVGEFVENGKNGMLYRYEEPYELAHCILTIFNDRDYASKLGKSATFLQQKYNMRQSGRILFDILLSSKRK